jgi:hypothetical protein
MTAAEFPEGSKTLNTTCQEELLALVEELHEEQRAAKRAAVPVMS